MQQNNNLPRWSGEGHETEQVPYTREEMEALQATLLRGVPVDMGDAFKGRLVAVLVASGTLLIERDNYPDVEISLFNNPVIH